MKRLNSKDVLSPRNRTHAHPWEYAGFLAGVRGRLHLGSSAQAGGRPVPHGPGRGISLSPAITLPQLAGFIINFGASANHGVNGMRGGNRSRLTRRGHVLNHLGADRKDVEQELMADLDYGIHDAYINTGVETIDELLGQIFVVAP